MLQFLLVTALQFWPNMNLYGNPYPLYIQRNSIVTLSSTVAQVCTDSQYKECSQYAKELCEMSLTNHRVVVVEGECSKLERRIKGGLR
jgi:hypothetical protein